MAIHIAAIKGNKRVIDILLKEFRADPYALTTNGLSALHNAA